MIYLTKDKPRLYAPAISEEQLHRLWLLKEKTGTPIARLLARALEMALPGFELEVDVNTVEK